MSKVVHGNLLDLAEQGRFDVVVHGCNCLHVMGAGIALQIRKRWPEAWSVDQKTPRPRLGTYSLALVKRGGVSFYVANAYTQPRPGPHVDLIAVRDVFDRLQTDFSGKRFGYPRIGAGLGGGDWSTIAGIIDAELAGEDHTLVEYKP